MFSPFLLSCFSRVVHSLLVSPDQFSDAGGGGGGVVSACCVSEHLSPQRGGHHQLGQHQVHGQSFCQSWQIIVRQDMGRGVGLTVGKVHG